MQAAPDWATLGEVNFLIHRRLADRLNAALAAISLIGTQEAVGQADVWRERSLNEVLNSLSIHEAWSSLIRYHLGEQFLPQHKRQFNASEILRWLASEMQLSNNTPLPKDVILMGNRETLQEALHLLYGCAYTLGPGVNLSAHIERKGMWFRVGYRVWRTSPESLDELIAGLKAQSTSWRAQTTAFELERARDFLTMNGCDLTFTSNEGVCELAFFIQSLGTRKLPVPLVATRSALAPTPLKPQLVLQANDDEDNIKTHVGPGKRSDVAAIKQPRDTTTLV